MKKRIYRRLFRFGPPIPLKKNDPAKLRKMYDDGKITWHEFQHRVVEWSTDSSGRKFYYICPKCHAPMRHCPDSACAEDSVGHHLLEEDWEGCDEDIPYSTAIKYLEPIGDDNKAGPGYNQNSWCVDMSLIEKVKKELDKAVQKVLAKYKTEDLPGCEFHGELIGLLQHQDHPETATGWYIQIGDGLPKGWIGPLPGKHHYDESKGNKPDA